MRTFLGIDDELSTLETARVALLPVPYDATTSFMGGARHAPEAVVRASYHIEEYDEELRTEPYRCGIHTAEPVEPHVGDPEVMVRRIQQRCAALLEAGKLVITLGGDHTVAVGAVRAHAERYGPLSVLQIDAHADLRPTYEGSRYSHACAARRCWEAEGVQDVVGVGIRALSRDEARWLADRDRPVFFAHEIARRDETEWIDEVVETLGPRVYVTFDVDGLDPAVLPATGTPEPGGLSWWTALRLLRRVSEAREVVGADACELLPTAGLHASDVTVARLVYKMIGYFVGSESHEGTADETSVKSR
jgi:agmatinase